MQRPRRLRRGVNLRNAVADVTLEARQLVLPLFVASGSEAKAVGSMPGVSQWPVSMALDHIAAMRERGLRQFLLFGVTPAHRKDAAGGFAASPEAPVNALLSEVRRAKLDVVMYADLCLCEYTSHGHCGVLHSDAAITVDNDATLKVLGQTAVAQARAGADVVAPSGMMDGQVGAVRAALDAAGLSHTAILAYSVKYASSLYGPFREAGEGGMSFGDREGYQMDFRRAREWRTELKADLDQGADMVMVKPGATYLDIVRQVREACDVPVAAYHVSGEYAMIHAAAERGWLDLRKTALEVTFSMRRAGADLIITYFADRLLDWL